MTIDPTRWGYDPRDYPPGEAEQLARIDYNDTVRIARRTLEANPGKAREVADLYGISLTDLLGGAA